MRRKGRLKDKLFYGTHKEGNMRKEQTGDLKKEMNYWDYVKFQRSYLRKNLLRNWGREDKMTEDYSKCIRCRNCKIKYRKRWVFSKAVAICKYAEMPESMFQHATVLCCKHFKPRKEKVVC